MKNLVQLEKVHNKFVDEYNWGASDILKTTTKDFLSQYTSSQFLFSDCTTEKVSSLLMLILIHRKW